MKVKDAVVERFKDICEYKNLKPNELATKAGVTPSSVYSMFDGKCGNPSFKTIKMICDSLDMDIKDFFDSELFINLEKGFT